LFPFVNLPACKVVAFYKKILENILTAVNAKQKEKLLGEKI